MVMDEETDDDDDGSLALDGVAMEDEEAAVME